MAVTCNNEKLITEKDYVYTPSTSILYGQQHKYSSFILVCNLLYYFSVKLYEN